MSRRTGPAVVLVTAALAVALSACSSHGSDPGNGASSQPAPTATTTGTAIGAGDPCRYATKDEVAGAIGTTVAVAQPVGEGESLQCAYFPTAPDASGGATSNALFIKFSRADVGLFDFQRNHADAESVTGLGDDAYWLSPFLRVKAAGGVLAIGVMDVRWNNGDSKGAAIKVAQPAVARLP